MVAPLLIIAVGNESRGDDALGPLLLGKLGKWLKERNLDGKVELLEDFQLQIEHAADMVGRECVLFIDAAVNIDGAYRFYRARPDDHSGAFSHALAPEAVLATYQRVYRSAPPRSFVLGIGAAQFELGTPPSLQALQHMEAALGLVQGLLGGIDEADWGVWDAASQACV
jgi:hydrogenase maturation protease